MKVKVKINRVLGCFILFYIEVEDKTLKLKDNMTFSNLTKLKEYYQIDKTKRTNEKGLAYSDRGRRFEWNIIEAEIDDIYVKQNI
jgi:hypothetical protein